MRFFENQIRPLLAARCTECHGTEAQQGGVRLDARAGVFGGEFGPAVVPGDPDDSRLVQVLAHAEFDVGMPPEGKLVDEEVALLTEWVRRGAPWPADAEPAGDGPGDDPAADPLDHWAYRLVRNPPVPHAAGSTPVDRFLNARLAGAGLDPAEPADRRTQVRRLSLDLLGVPPTWGELRAALADGRPDWWPRLVDRVLADPRHGPRWARHWLDVARYADTRGYRVAGQNTTYPFAWTYRDYVVAAFNGDKAYDEFVTEQLAADRLVAAGELPPNAPELAALGFLTLGDRFIDNPVLIADDRVDVTSRGLLGLTVACARCHDHKFDAIPTEDYYALYGVFRSSAEPDELPPIGEPADTPAVRAFAAEKRRLEAEEAALRDRFGREIAEDLRARFGAHLAKAAGFEVGQAALRGAFVGRLRKALDELGPDDARLGEWVRVKRDPGEFTQERVAALAARFDAPDPADGAASAAADRYATLPDGRFFGYANTKERNAVRQKRAAVEAFVAGHPHAPPRAQALADRGRRERNTVFIRGDAGRRGDEVVPHAAPSCLTGGELVELADGEVSGRRALAAAVTDPANPLTARVIVNRVWAWRFGTGLVDTPSDFGVQGGRPSHPDLLDWLATDFVAHGWSLKHLHRRIVLSDAYRRTAGPAAGTAADPGNRLLGHFPRRRLEWEAWRDAALHVSGVLERAPGGRPADLFDEQTPHRRRTVFGFVNRNDLPGVLRNFDLPSPQTSAAGRTESAVPQQALFALNGPHLAGWAAALAAGAGGDVATLYRRALQRDPTAEEAARAAAFLRSAGPDGPALLAGALLMSNEFAFLE